LVVLLALVENRPPSQILDRIQKNLEKKLDLDKSPRESLIVQKD
jgi:hypothetical protein